MRLAENSKLVSFARAEHDDSEEISQVEQTGDEEEMSEEELKKLEQELEEEEISTDDE